MEMSIGTSASLLLTRTTFINNNRKNKTGTPITENIRNVKINLIQAFDCFRQNQLDQDKLSQKLTHLPTFWSNFQQLKALKVLEIHFTMFSAFTVIFSSSHNHSESEIAKFKSDKTYVHELLPVETDSDDEFKLALTYKAQDALISSFFVQYIVTLGEAINSHENARDFIEYSNILIPSLSAIAQVCLAGLSLDSSTLTKRNLIYDIASIPMTLTSFRSCFYNACQNSNDTPSPFRIRQLSGYTFPSINDSVYLQLVGYTPVNFSRIILRPPRSITHSVEKVDLSEFSSNFI